MNRSPRQALIFLALLLGVSGAAAQQGQLPQIPAFLPMMTAVPATAAQPIDGTWSISSIGKRIRFEGGRAYAVDPWVHLFVLSIQPGMVVIKDVRATGSGAYAGFDLPLMGAWQARSGPGGVLDVQVASMIPATYQLIPVQLDNPSWYQDEIQRASAPSGQPPIAGALPGAAPADPAPPVAPSPIEPPAEGDAAPPPATKPPPATAPARPPSEGVSCREVVYREETDDYQCVQ